MKKEGLAMKMTDMIQNLYKLIHTPIVTPFNLLENSKLKNYNYVKYYKGSAGLVCEMECVVEERLEKFFYFFDNKDYLQKIERQTKGSKRELLFDRSTEINVKKSQFSKQRQTLGKTLTS